MSPKQQVRGFPADAGQTQVSSSIVSGDLSAVVARSSIWQASHNVPRLVLVEAAGADVVFHTSNGGRPRMASRVG